MWFPDYWYGGGGGGDVNVPYVNFTFWMVMAEVCSRKWTGQFLPQRWQGGLVRELAPACHSAFKWFRCFEYVQLLQQLALPEARTWAAPARAGGKVPPSILQKKAMNFPGQREYGSDIPAGDGKIINLFLQYKLPSRYKSHIPPSLLHPSWEGRRSESTL